MGDLFGDEELEQERFVGLGRTDLWVPRAASINLEKDRKEKFF